MFELKMLSSNNKPVFYLSLLLLPVSNYRSTGQTVITKQRICKLLKWPFRVFFASPIGQEKEQQAQYYKIRYSIFEQSLSFNSRSELRKLKKKS